MKKFYTSALAALCVFGVSAGINGAQLRSDVVMKTAPHSALNQNKSMGLSFKKVASDKVMSRAGEDEEEFSIYGEYTMYVGDYYRGENSLGSIEETATIEEYDEGFILIDSEYFLSPVLAGYDEATGVISFSQVKLGDATLGDGNTYYIRLEPFHWDNSAEKIVPANFDANFDASTGTISFPSEHGFLWAAYTDSKYKMKKGNLAAFEVEGMEPYVEDTSDPNEGWTTVGTATLIDAWISAAYRYENGEGVNPEDFPIEAELQQNDEVETLYRLVNPYHDPNWLLVDANQSSKTGYIVFDIANPDHVIVKAGVPAGFKNSNGEFYVFNMLGWLINRYGAQWDDSMLPDVYQLFEEEGIPNDTYADNVVTVNTPVFDISPRCSNPYSWQDVIYTVSSIIMDIDSDINGISVIEADENAPVEYFNLQGVRVDNPAAGQVVIKRQGAKATKTIVR